MYLKTTVCFLLVLFLRPTSWTHLWWLSTFNYVNYISALLDSQVTTWKEPGLINDFQKGRTTCQPASFTSGQLSEKLLFYLSHPIGVFLLEQLNFTLAKVELYLEIQNIIVSLL